MRSETYHIFFEHYKSLNFFHISLKNLLISFSTQKEVLGPVLVWLIKIMQPKRRKNENKTSLPPTGLILDKKDWSQILLRNSVEVMRCNWFYKTKTRT